MNPARLQAPSNVALRQTVLRELEALDGAGERARPNAAAAHSPLETARSAFAELQAQSEGSSPASFPSAPRLSRDAARELHDIFSELGCLLAKEPVLPASLIHAAQAMATAYANGRSVGPLPWRVLGKRGPGELLKVDQPHCVDTRLALLASHPRLLALAAAVTGAEHVRPWATQLLIKMPGPGQRANVGWHTDTQYWPWLAKDLLTVWVALTPVNSKDGPVEILLGSHRDARVRGGVVGDAFAQERDAQLDALGALGARPRARLELQPGGLGLFAASAFHSSGPNLGLGCRAGFAVHYMTERTVFNATATV